MILAGHEYDKTSDMTARAWIMDVGQGDAILLRSATGKHVLVDGGPDTSVLERLPEHMPLLRRTIDLVILSHPDADHVTGLPDVLRRYRVRNVLMAGTRHASARHHDFIAAIERSGARVIRADPSVHIKIDRDMLLDIIHPTASYVTGGSRGNDQSIVVNVITRSGSLLLTGDIERDAEVAILKSGEHLGSDYIKVPHHGSRTSSSTGFLLAVGAEKAVVSAAGSEHRLNHPHTDVVRRYADMNVLLRGTHEEGTVEISL